MDYCVSCNVFTILCSIISLCTALVQPLSCEIVNENVHISKFHVKNEEGAH